MHHFGWFRSDNPVAHGGSARMQLFAAQTGQYEGFVWGGCACSMLSIVALTLHRENPGSSSYGVTLQKNVGIDQSIGLHLIWLHEGIDR